MAYKIYPEVTGNLKITILGGKMSAKRGEEFIFDSVEQEVNDAHGNKIILKGYHRLRKVTDYRLFGRIKEWLKGESWYIVDNDLNKVVNCYGYVEDRCLQKVTP